MYGEQMGSWGAWTISALWSDLWPYLQDQKGVKTGQKGKKMDFEAIFLLILVEKENVHYVYSV